MGVAVLDASYEITEVASAFEYGPGDCNGPQPLVPGEQHTHEIVELYRPFVDEVVRRAKSE